MSGFEADLDAIGGTADALRSTVDSMASVADHLDGSVCAGLGPGRIREVGAGLVADTRRELDRVLGALAADAALIEQVRSGYLTLDEDVAGRLERGPW